MTDAAAASLPPATKFSRKQLRVIFFGARVLLYGLMGMALEIVFYQIVRLGKASPLAKTLFNFDWGVDPALKLQNVWDTPWYVLYGQCSVYMFAIYVVASLVIGKAWDLGLWKLHWALRAPIYGVWILLWEWASGHALKALTGYAIWFYGDPLGVPFQHMTSLGILPIWMVVGLVAEFLHRQFQDPDFVEALASPLKPYPVDPLPPV